MIFIDVGNIRLVEVIPVRSLHVAHGPGLGLEIIMAPIGISRVGGINHAAPLEQVHIACKSIAPGFRRIKPLRALIEAHIAAGCKFPCIGVVQDMIPINGDRQIGLAGRFVLSPLLTGLLFFFTFLLGLNRLFRKLVRFILEFADGFCLRGPSGHIIDGLRLIGRTVFSGKGLAVICPSGVGRTRHAYHHGNE